MKRITPEASSYSNGLVDKAKRRLLIQPGTNCWLQTLTAKGVNFLHCTVLSVVGNSAHVALPGRQTILTEDISNLHECGDNFLQADTAELTTLNYPNVLETIRQRFELASSSSDARHLIYTYAGWVLFAVNPYHLDTNLYNDNWCEKYYRKTITQVDPHPFAIASVAYTKLISDQQSQYILISGESGGGKTECSKHVVKFLTWVTRRQRRLKGRASVGGPGDAAERMAELLIAANPLLEFFGNAKTSRNDNSSRFGKLLQIHFDHNGEHLLSANLSTYLLAKSRVVQVPSGEENYHAFHSLILGLDENELADLHLTSSFTSPFLGTEKSSDSSYYQPGGTFHIRRLQEILRACAISDSVTHNILQILASILHIGNLEFELNPDGEAKVVNQQVLSILCQLWGISLDGGVLELEEKLTSKQIRDTRGRLSLEQCRQTSFSLAKGLYESLFDFVVFLIRQQLEAEETRFTSSHQSGPQTLSEGCVGVLDLFGFEDMEPDSSNGFEQLCINYANEQLHTYFMREIVERERETCRKEGIVLDPVASGFTDIMGMCQSDALAMLLGLKGTPGIFAILDDESRLSGPDRNGTFCRRTRAVILSLKTKQSPNKKRKNANGAASQTLQFALDHFAGPVTYQADGFVERNQDHMSDELRQYLSVVTGAHVRNLLAAKSEAEDAAKKVTTSRSLSATFVKQMAGLTSSLEKTSCYFIKCLKPNDLQQSYMFDPPRVLQQLVTGGVGPVLELMKQGYPCRISYDSLWRKYRQYLPPRLLERVRAGSAGRPELVPYQMNPRDFTELVVNFSQINPDLYRLGASRIFFKFGVLQEMEELMQEFDDSSAERFAIEMHRFYIENQLYRVFYAVVVGFKLCRLARRKRYGRIAKLAVAAYHEIWLPGRQRRAAGVIQNYMRSVPQRILFLRMRRAARVLQNFLRRRRLVLALYRAAEYHRKLVAARVILALLVAHSIKLTKSRAQALDTRAAIKIQAAWRGCRIRNIFREAQREYATITVQRVWRGYRVRSQLKKKKLAEPHKRLLVRSYSKSSLRRASVAFQETRVFWEIASANPKLAPNTIGGELRRRRRSLFCTGLTPSPRHFAAFVDANPIEEADPEFYSPDISSPVATPDPPQWAPEHTDIVSSSTIYESQKRSRRCIESGARFGGLDSAAVVNLIAECLEESNSCSPLADRPITKSPRLSVSDLPEPVMGNLPCKSNVRVSLDSALPPVANGPAAVKDRPLIPPPVLPSKFHHAPNELLRSEPPCGNRLSIRAWKMPFEELPGPQPSFSGSALTPIRSGGVHDIWGTTLCSEGQSISDEEPEATPLFGRRSLANDTDDTKSEIAEERPSSQWSQMGKENTPRPYVGPKQSTPQLRKPLASKMTLSTKPKSMIPSMPDMMAPSKRLSLFSLMGVTAKIITVRKKAGNRAAV